MEQRTKRKAHSSGRAKRISETLFLWALGGSVYYLLEIAARGFSHWSMFVVGGLAFLFCTYQGLFMHWTEPMYVQLIRAVLLLTAMEFVTGLIVNKWLDLQVWDYTDQPLQLWGQICVPFMVLFSGLLTLGILLGGTISYRIFREEKPHFFVIGEKNN